MYQNKSFWKRTLFIILSCVMVAVLITGCAGETKEEKPLIKFYDGSWESLWISNAIAQFILEEGYGYETETVTLDTAVMMVSIVEGDVHVNLETWWQNMLEWWFDNLEAGTIIELADCLEGGPQFYIIPQWVHEEYGINTIDDMKEHWELFKDPEDQSKGQFINCRIGWTCGEINKVKMETYGIDEYYNIIEPGSAGAMDAALVGAMLKEEPIFGYYWAPTAIMGMYDWHILEEPEYDEDLWADIDAAMADDTLRPVAEVCAYPSVPLPISMNAEFAEKVPDVVAVFNKMVIGLDKMNKMAAWSQDNDINDYTETAIWFFNEYESLWRTWITTDAYNKVKDALEAY